MIVGIDISDQNFIRARGIPTSAVFRLYIDLERLMIFYTLGIIKRVRTTPLETVKLVRMLTSTIRLESPQIRPVRCFRSITRVR